MQELIEVLQNHHTKNSLVSSCALYESTFSVYEHWKNRDKENSTLNKERTYGALYKKEDKVFHKFLSEIEYETLERLNDTSLPAALESLDFTEKNLQDFFEFLGFSRILK